MQINQNLHDVTDGTEPLKVTSQYGNLSSSASPRKESLLDDQCPRQVMLQTGWKVDRARRTTTDSAAQPTVKWNHPSRIHSPIGNQLSCASPTIDFQNIFGNLRQTELLWHSAGSTPLNDVNYPPTNDSNTPENSSELSDIPLPCRSSSFKCKSAFISPRHRNSSLHTYCISYW